MSTFRWSSIRDSASRYRALRQARTPDYSLYELAVLGLLFLLTLVAGCSREGERVPVFATTGKLLVNGQGASGVALALTPVGGEASAVRAFATTDSSGAFSFSTYGSQDGAPAGQFAVTASWRQLAPLDPSSDEAPALGPEQIPLAYQKADQTPLKVTVAATPQNDLGVLQISGDAPPPSSVDFSSPAVPISE